MYMRILMVTPSQTGIGGTAKHVRGLSDFLRSKDHHVTIISSENTFTIPIKKLKNPSFMISSLIKTKFSGNYDIIHAHHPIASLSFKASSAKKIVTFHGIYSKQIGILHGNTASNFSNKYEKNALSWTDAITAGSKESFEHYSEQGYTVNYIPNAIDVTSLPIHVNKKFEKQIIFVGRLSKEKGVESIIKICKTLPSEFHLLIIGSGPMEKEIKKIDELYSNVHYLGYLEKEDLIPILRGSMVLIQPSLVEGISTTVLEAMACKVPIIASDVGGNKELVLNNQNGFLINPDSPGELLEKILQISKDLQLQQKFGQTSFELVKKFEWKEIGQKYLDLYESLLAN